MQPTMGIDIFEALQMLECRPQFGKPESHLTCQISPSFVLLFHHWYPSCCLPSWQMWWLNDSFYIQIAYAADVFMWITTKVQYVWLENLRTGLLASCEGFLPLKVLSMHLCLLRSRREIETLPTTIVLDCFSTSPNRVQFTNCNWPRTNSQKIRFSQLAPAAAQNTKNFRWIVFFRILILILSLEVLCFRY